VDWRWEKLRLGWNGRFESEQLATGVSNDDLESNPDFVNIPKTDNSVVHDFTGSYFFTERFELFAGINNAFDEEPFIGALSRPTGPRGRFFFAGLNVTL